MLKVACACGMHVLACWYLWHVLVVCGNWLVLAVQHVVSMACGNCGVCTCGIRSTCMWHVLACWYLWHVLAA